MPARMVTIDFTVGDEFKSAKMTELYNFEQLSEQYGFSNGTYVLEEKREIDYSYITQTGRPRTRRRGITGSFQKDDFNIRRPFINTPHVILLVGGDSFQINIDPDSRIITSISARVNNNSFRNINARSLAFGFYTTSNMPQFEWDEVFSEMDYSPLLYGLGDEAIDYGTAVQMGLAGDSSYDEELTFGGA